MRVSKAIAAFVIISLALLLLSALVVYDAPEAAAAPDNATPIRVTLLPIALPAHDAGAATAPNPITPRALASLLIITLFAAPALPVAHDANGRVLSAARYENSFYPVFRPEVAGG